MFKELSNLSRCAIDFKVKGYSVEAWDSRLIKHNVAKERIKNDNTQ